MRVQRIAGELIANCCTHSACERRLIDIYRPATHFIMCKAARQLLNTAKQQRKASPTMTSHLAEAGRTLIPRKDDRYGLLSPALVILTFVAGLVDALSYLALGHVFVANVTGNIVFLGFAFAHAQGFVWWTSALTLATFMIGAFIGGRMIHYFGANRARHLLVSTSIQLAFVGSCARRHLSAQSVCA